MITPRMLRDVWAFRGFILSSVKREFHSRYLGTQFGPFWAIIQPLALITLYTVVFAKMMRPALPGHDSPFAYSIYLCAGLLSWTLFSELLGRSVSIFVHHANLLKKVNVPKLSLPLIVVFSSLLHHAIVMGIFLGFLLLTGSFPGWAVVAAVPVIAILIAFAVGLGILCGTVNVFYRDVEQAVGLVMQFWFWLTPIVYVTKALPDFLAQLLQWNPLWPIVRALQGIFLENRLPQWSTLAYPALLSAALVYLGMVAFARLNGEIVDEL